MNKEEMMRIASAKAERQIHEIIEHQDGHLKLGNDVSRLTFLENDDGSITLLEPDGDVFCKCPSPVNAIIIAKIQLESELMLQNALMRMGIEAIIKATMKEKDGGTPDGIKID